MIFSDLFGAFRKINKKLWKMANDGKFIGVMEHFLENTQAEV